MAKKPTDGVSKSQAIRDYVATHPGDGPKAVAAALTKSGIKVSAAFVSTVKSTDKRKMLGPGRRGAHANGSLDATLRALESAKQLVDQMGGVNEAKKAIDAYGKLIV